MHPVILQDLASEHVRDMQLAATAAAPRFSAMASDMSVRHA